MASVQHYTQKGRERSHHGKLCLCTSFSLQTSTAWSCSMESSFQGIGKRRLDLEKKYQGLLLGGDLESLGLGDSLYILGQDGCCAAELPPVLSLLKSPIPSGSAFPASILPAHTKCSSWKSAYNFKVGLRSLHLVFRVPECCFIRITVLFFLGFSRRL